MFLWKNVTLGDNKMKNADLNFFLVDNNDKHYYLLSIYCYGTDKTVEYDLTEELKEYDFDDYIRFCELVAEHHNQVYLEIVNLDWEKILGFDRFWIDMNTKKILDNIPMSIYKKYVNY